MKVTGDQQLMKKMNKAIVLNTIRQQQPLSRADISATIGLNKATVSSLVSELIDSRLVTEIGPGVSSGGRKPTLLLFNKNAGYAVGIDIRVSDLLAVLVDLEGNVIEERTFPLADVSSNYVIEQLQLCIAELVSQAPLSPYGLIGIGIGVPGLVNERGDVVSAPNLGWENVSLASPLADHFNVSVHIDNEANAGATSEKLFGAGRDSNNLIYVSIGVGIGAGMMISDELYRGISNFSGEVGHMTIVENGPICRCGNEGCWETLASEKALLKQAAELWGNSGNETSSISLSFILDKAENGDEAARELFRSIGYHLGIGLSNLINILNPELIVIGNRLSVAGKWLEPSILETFNKRSLTYHRQKAELVFAELGVRSTALGAAAFAITHFLMEADTFVLA